MVRVWDGPTRAFHWLLVLLFFNAWVTFNYAPNDPTLKWHRINGYCILILLVFRLIWGFAGSSTSRFSSFVRGPGATIRYGLGLLSKSGPKYLGHNPLGTWMLLALMLAMTTQAVFGLFTLEHNDAAAGPLKRLFKDPDEGTNAWVLFFSKWHRRGFDLILYLITAHVLANVLYGLVKREPLIRAMITGKKPRGDYADGAEATIAGYVWLRALVCLLIAAAIVLVPLRIFGADLV